MRKFFFPVLLTCATLFTVVPANAVLSPKSIPAAFKELLKIPALSNPAMILIDVKSGEVIFERNSDSQRKPASVMKILSGVAVLEYLDPKSSFETNISFGSNSKSLIIQGSYDPWISLNNVVAKKMHRTSLPHLAYKAMSELKAANHGSLRHIKVQYSGLYSQDVENLRAYWARRGFRPSMKSVGVETSAPRKGKAIVLSKSPPVSEILDFTLLWSDNLLAERLARLASKAAGHELNDQGVATTFTELLKHFDIDSSKIIIADASGLSKANRVTAQIIGQLLLKTRKDEKFALLYGSLPVAGVSGTLKNRYVTTAPSAVGLIHAKTGTLNGTVTLAGYVESGDHEYVFVTLADEIASGTRAENKARAAIDRLLGRIAAPNIQAQIFDAGKTP